MNFSCPDCRERLALLLENALSPEARAAVETHLQTCADCQKEWEIVQNLRASLRNIEPMEAPPNLRLRVREALQNDPQPRSTPIWKIHWRPVGLVWTGGATALAMGLLLLASNPQKVALVLPDRAPVAESASAPPADALKTDGGQSQEAAAPSAQAAKTKTTRAIKNNAPAAPQSVPPSVQSAPAQPRSQGMPALPPPPAEFAAPLVPPNTQKSAPVTVSKREKQTEAAKPNTSTLSARPNILTPPSAPRQSANAARENQTSTLLKPTAPQGQLKKVPAPIAPPMPAAPPTDWFAARLAPLPPSPLADSVSPAEERENKSRLRGGAVAKSNSAPASAPSAAFAAPAEAGRRAETNELLRTDQASAMVVNRVELRLTITPHRAVEQARLRVILPKNLHFFDSQESERMVWQGATRENQPILVILPLENTPQKPLEIVLEQIGSDGATKVLQSQRIAP